MHDKYPCPGIHNKPHGQGYSVLFSANSIDCDKKHHEFTGVINLFSVVSLSHG